MPKPPKSKQKVVIKDLRRSSGPEPWAVLTAGVALFLLLLAAAALVGPAQPTVYRAADLYYYTK